MEDKSSWHRDIGDLNCFYCFVSSDGAGVDVLKLWGRRGGYRLIPTSPRQSVCVYVCVVQ